MRFVRCKTTSGYEAMISLRSRRTQYWSTCKNPSARLRFLPRARVSAYQNA